MSVPEDGQPRAFPVVVSRLDEPDVEDTTCATLDELGEDLEFYDEFAKERISVISATGIPIRVIAYALEVLLCVPVERLVTPGDLSISRCRGVDAPAAFGFAELHEGRVHRVLWDDGTADPRTPFGAPPLVELTSGDTPTAREFSARWAAAASSRSWP